MDLGRYQGRRRCEVVDASIGASHGPVAAEVGSLSKRGWRRTSKREPLFPLPLSIPALLADELVAEGKQEEEEEEDQQGELVADADAAQPQVPEEGERVPLESAEPIPSSMEKEEETDNKSEEAPRRTRSSTAAGTEQG